MSASDKPMPVVVIGIGNLLMRDEGVGIHALRLLLGVGERHGVALIDGGTPGLRLLSYLEGRRKAIIIDAADMQFPPGTVRRFRPEQVVSTKTLPRQSLHEGDLMETLALAKGLGIALPEIVIVGVQPKTVEIGDTLTPDVEEALPEVLRIVNEEIADPPPA